MSGDHENAAAICTCGFEMLRTLNVEERPELFDAGPWQPHEVGISLGVVAEVVPGDQPKLFVGDLGKGRAEVHLERPPSAPSEDEGEAGDHDRQRVGKAAGEPLHQPLHDAEGAEADHVKLGPPVSVGMRTTARDIPG